MLGGHVRSRESCQLRLISAILHIQRHLNFSVYSRFPSFTSRILRLSYLSASVSSFDLPFAAAAAKTGRRAFPYYSCFPQLSVFPPPPPPPLPRHPLCCWFDNRLSQVFNVFSESAGCPSRAADLPVGGRAAGREMTIAFAGKWKRKEHLRRGEERPSVVSFHPSFDWTVIVICGPHCNPVKGSGINKWCNYKTLM